MKKDAKYSWLFPEIKDIPEFEGEINDNDEIVKTVVIAILTFISGLFVGLVWATIQFGGL